MTEKEKYRFNLFISECINLASTVENRIAYERVKNFIDKFEVIKDPVIGVTVIDKINEDLKKENEAKGVETATLTDVWFNDRYVFHSKGRKRTFVVPGKIVRDTIPKGQVPIHLLLQYELIYP